MKKEPSPSPKAAELRRRAEARLRKNRCDQRPAVRGRRSDTDTQRLLHELQVHQIELELQNTELQETRDRIEALLEKYLDLYDFAPVGYLSLDEEGMILEVNLTGAAMLGVDRSRLFQRRVQDFVAPVSLPVFLACLAHVFKSPAKRVCEVMLKKRDGTSFWADLQAVSALLPSRQRWCRVAISDITALKGAEESRRQLEALARANRELNREITRRRRLEKNLRNSEQHQRQLLRQSRHMQARLRQLSHEILQAQEEERRRISRELHDEIAQTLVGINVHLEALARAITLSPQQLKRKLTRTQRIVEKSVNIVQQFARELRPTALDDLGLIAALHSYMRDFMKRTGVRVDFTTSAGVEHLNSARRTVVYRVVHSAFTNVAQHAQASRVKVSIREIEDAVHLEISDDGRSFNVEQLSRAKRNKHLGLLGMRERVEMVGGSFNVESAPGQGTTVRAQIPFGRKPARGGRHRSGRLKPGSDKP
jgi:PAS domain S-box-containing protein